MPEQVRKFCNNNLMAFYLMLAVVLAAGFGYSIGVRESVSAVVELSKDHAKERVSVRRHYSLQLSAMRKENIALQDELKARAGGQQ